VSCSGVPKACASRKVWRTVSLKAPRASPGKPIVFAPHERATTLDDVLEAVRRLEDTVGEQWLATNSQLGTLSKRLQRLERRLAK